MGGFGVKHHDGNGHCFSIVSLGEEDLSVSRKLYLPFEKDEEGYVVGGSCGGLLYFHEKNGEIVIVNLTTNESIVIPPPDFDPLTQEIEMIATGLGYDAKSGEYKVMRYYDQDYLDENRYRDCKNFFELYRFKSFGSWKELRRPRVDGTVYDGTVYHGTGVYVGETGSCYWTGCNNPSPEEYPECVAPYEQHLQRGTEFDGSVDSPLMHVLSFDFAAESFSWFPLPATAMGLGVIYKLVSYCGSLGALVYRPTCARIAVELFVWKGKEEGSLWKRVHDVVYIDDAEVPVGLKDDRLFLEAKASGGRCQLMVYDYGTNQLKKLDIYNYDRPKRMSVVSYGTDSVPLPDSIPKADYDFSRKMRASTKGKKKKSKKGKKSRR